MFVPTKANLKSANWYTVHAQGIGIILCGFTNCTIIYLVESVYYCPGHPFNTVSLGLLKWNVGFQKVLSETLENFDFPSPSRLFLDIPLPESKILNYLQIVIFRSQASNKH